MVDLRERHLGVLEGLTRFEAAQQHPADFANLSGSPDAKPQACRNTICYNNNHHLQAFQLIVFARYLLGVPNPSAASQHALSPYAMCAWIYAVEDLSRPLKMVDSVQGGESQDEVAQRVVSRIEQIASQHPGKTPRMFYRQSWAMPRSA